MRSGWIEITKNALRKSGLFGFLWSSYATDSAWGASDLGAYAHGFGETKTYSSYGPDRCYNAFPPPLPEYCIRDGGR